ncbi:MULTISPECIES: hypothetical protein [Clostridium]|uniref:Uncharacterized protein n=1 Tax=Clostridium frigoriphilum TaxID=443253 RepID=A0ABU7UVV0_9CLOT|nr:hypothetical protein [Clostridium sp. DSM 17811]MBU3098761.1 hypothetical protein [Clostridium sp. DSM 17811]
MMIKKWKGRINLNTQKSKLKDKGAIDMVVQLANYNRQDPTINISLIDMIFNKENRKVMYAKYDKNYQSTKEEDDIYNDMRGNYREED